MPTMIVAVLSYLSQSLSERYLVDYMAAPLSRLTSDTKYLRQFRGDGREADLQSAWPEPGHDIGIVGR